MPLATSNVFTSVLSSSKLTGRIRSENFQSVSAMREIKNAATENVDRFSKLRILEVLGASQPSKYLQGPVSQSNESAACVPMTVAVAEFKGPKVFGVVRFAQASDGQQSECSIEAVIDGLTPGAHGWSIHEFGDLTRGAFSTGPAYSFPTILPKEECGNEVGCGNKVGNLGTLMVDSVGHVQCASNNGRITVADIIGRSVVLYGHGYGGDSESLTTRLAAAVIARSARPSSLSPQLCNCDGSLIWQSNSCS